jgi:hypothetical protein
MANYWCSNCYEWRQHDGWHVFAIRYDVCGGEVTEEHHDDPVIVDYKEIDKAFGGETMKTTPKPKQR